MTERGGAVMRGQRYLCFTEVFYRKHEREKTEKKHHIIFLDSKLDVQVEAIKMSHQYHNHPTLRKVP